MPTSSNERSGRRASIHIIALLTTAAAVLAPASAQDYTWQPLGLGMNDYVYALTVFNGELIAGGNFTTAGGVTCNRIARWNGSTWQPLGAGMDGTVRTLTVFNGELIAGGEFSTAGGVTCHRIARWTVLWGACCFVDGSCEVLSPTACDAAGGAYQGNRTTCDPNPCPQYAACCYPDGSCAVTTEPGCAGIWHPEWADCNVAECPQPETGACCFADGSCAVLSPTACDTAAGTYQGHWTACDPNPCPYAKGDVNCDHAVNVDDIPYFVAALIGEYTGCDITLADLDNSGTVDGADIAPFVTALLGGS